MNSYTWIEEAKTKTGLNSDYAIAKELGLTRGAISNHKTGKLKSLDDKTCLKLAKMLNIPAEQIILDQKAQAADTPELRKLWANLAKKAVAASPIILTVAFLKITNIFNGLAFISAQQYMLCLIDKAVIFHKMRACFPINRKESSTWNGLKSY